MLNKSIGFLLLFAPIIIGSYSCDKKVGKRKEPAIDVRVKESEKVNGIFFLGREYKITGSNLTAYSLQLHVPAINAIFSDSLADVFSFYPEADVGEIKLNGTPLAKVVLENTLYYFGGYTSPKSAAWEVSGNSNFDSFNYTDNNAYPLYSDFFLIPDTIVIAKNNTISVENYEAEKVILTIFCETTAKIITRVISQPLHSFQLNDSTLAYLIKDYPRLPVSLRFDFYNEAYLSVGKRAYLFRRGYTLTKENVILSTL